MSVLKITFRALALLLGLSALVIVGCLIWRDLVHGSGVSGVILTVLLLAGIPLAITWHRDLAADLAVLPAGLLALCAFVCFGMQLTAYMTDESFWDMVRGIHREDHFPADATPDQIIEAIARARAEAEPVWRKASVYLVLALGGVECFLVAFIYHGSHACFHWFCRVFKREQERGLVI